MFLLIPKGFLPSEDQGRFNMTVEAIQGIGFEEMVRHQTEVAEIVAQDPDIIGTPATSALAAAAAAAGSSIRAGFRST